jgi:FkbM family methyltransferase
VVKNTYGGNVSIRSVLEQVTHPIVIRRRLPAQFGKTRIYVSTEGGLRYLMRAMSDVDPVLLRLAGNVVRPGQVVWDIGANLGLFSFAAAAAAGPAGRVLAVEPDTALAGRLRRSAALNRGHAPVEVLPVAVSDEVSVGRFHIARRNRSTSYLDGHGTTMTGGVRSTELVPTVTLDWLAAHFALPDVIKIDVEGAELTVLAGGAQLLERLPTLICEVGARNAAAVSGLLTTRGYALYDGDRPPGERVPAAVAPPNTLALGRGVHQRSPSIAAQAKTSSP